MTKQIDTTSNDDSFGQDAFNLDLQDKLWGSFRRRSQDGNHSPSHRVQTTRHWAMPASCGELHHQHVARFIHVGDELIEGRRGCEEVAIA
jgi:hypothetical protein